MVAWLVKSGRVVLAARSSGYVPALAVWKILPGVVLQTKRAITVGQLQ